MKMKRFKKIVVATIAVLCIMIILPSIALADVSFYVTGFIKNANIDSNNYEGLDAFGNYDMAAYYELVNDADINEFYTYVDKMPITRDALAQQYGVSFTDEDLTDYEAIHGSEYIYDTNEILLFDDSPYYAGMELSNEATNAKSKAYSFAPQESGLVPEVKLHANSAKVLSPSLFSLDGYTDGFFGKKPLPSNKYGVLRKTGTNESFKAEVSNPDALISEWDQYAPVLRIVGDMSWFNGNFYLDEGGLLIDENAVIFGGNIYMKPYTELEWQGGAKDEYNRTNIVMTGNGKLFFNLNNQPVFSQYAKITGTDSDRIVLDKGNYYLKNDASGFKGTVNAYNGTDIYVRKSDAGDSSVYQGTMFGGKLIIRDENGVPQKDSIVTVYSNTGLKPLTLDTGTLILKNDTEGTAQTNTPIDELTVGSDGIAKVTLSSSKLTDTVIEGVLYIDGEASFENLAMRSGGKLYLMQKPSAMIGDNGFSNATILGDASGSLAGTYDANGAYTPFALTAQISPINTFNDELTIDVTGLQDQTIPKGKIVIGYSLDGGKTAKVIDTKSIIRNTEHDTTATVKLTLQQGLPNDADMVVWYAPGAEDNYVAADTAPAAAEEVAPVIDDISASGITSTSAALHVVAIDDSLPLTYQWQVQNNGSWTNITDATTADYMYSGLVANTTYAVRVLITDALGNQVVSEVITFTTLANTNPTPSPSPSPSPSETPTAPATGDTSVSLIVLFGMMIIAGAGLLYVAFRKREANR